MSPRRSRRSARARAKDASESMAMPGSAMSLTDRLFGGCIEPLSLRVLSGEQSSGLAAALQATNLGFPIPVGRDGWRASKPRLPAFIRTDQLEAVNSGLPEPSLISAAQTLWIAVTTLPGIGT